MTRTARYQLGKGILVLLLIVAWALLGAAAGEEVGWCSWLDAALSPSNYGIVSLAIVAIGASYLYEFFPVVKGWHEGLGPKAKQLLLWAVIFAIGAIGVGLQWATCAGPITWELVWWPLIQKSLGVLGGATIFHGLEKPLRARVGLVWGSDT